MWVQPRDWSEPVIEGTRISHVMTINQSALDSLSDRASTISAFTPDKSGLSRARRPHIERETLGFRAVGAMLGLNVGSCANILLDFDVVLHHCIKRKTLTR